MTAVLDPPVEPAWAFPTVDLRLVQLVVESAATSADAPEGRPSRKPR